MIRSQDLRVEAPTGGDPGTRGHTALERFGRRSQTAARRSQIDAATLEAVEALGRAGVDALVLKGIALARLLYRADEPRGYFDLDLLVSPADLDRARHLLAELNYTDVNGMQGIDDVAGVLHAEPWARLVPDFGNVTVDLHWRLVGCGATAEHLWQTLSSRRTWIELGGQRLATLDRTGLALHLALHAAQHGPADAQAVGDLVHGLERWPPETWRGAARLADELQAREAFAAGLRLVAAGPALAAELGLPDGDRVLWEIAHRDERPRGTFHLDALTDARTFRERADVLRRSLFPTPAWIAWEYRWARDSRARMAAAYVVHLLRSPVWAVRAARYVSRARRSRR